MRSETNQMKKMNKKGFTLAELLIVVAIIAVLVAVAIPVFSNQLEKSKEATDMANIRAAYAEVTSAWLDDNAEHTASVPLKSKTSDWKSDADAEVAGVKAQTIIGTGTKTAIEVKITTEGAVTIDGQPATSGFMSES